MMNKFSSYQLALELYQDCQHLVCKYYLKDQLDRASLSVVLNLTEGSAKASPKEIGSAAGAATDYRNSGLPAAVSRGRNRETGCGTAGNKAARQMKSFIMIRHSFPYHHP